MKNLKRLAINRELVLFLGITQTKRSSYENCEYLFGMVLLLISCTPTALLNTIERNPAFATPQPPKMQNLKLVIALNGGYYISEDAMGKLKKYYQTSDTVEVYERLTAVISDVLRSRQFSLPKKMSVAEVAVVHSDDFPVDTRQTTETWRTGKRISKLKTFQPADLTTFLQKYHNSDFNYAVFCGKITITSVRRKEMERG